ncbi:hypothetical protein [Amphibacillus cookii]|uniref:hypothetical protein n=1 Tax=Amphibacillus cookii TaxID=767787 RepID=UPI001958BB91|nr:hypothetical protein [Amphibacillus cookii]MBM7541104.1 hypothetical protein [Amphibacillus cookii]
MDIYYKVNMSDLEAFQKDTVDTLPYYRKKKIVFSLVYAVIYFLITNLFVENNWILKLIGTLFVYFMCYRFAIKYSMIIEVKRLIKKNPDYLEHEHKLTISPDGLIREFYGTIQQENWKSIHYANEDEERYFLYISEIKKFLIKKHPHHLNEAETLEYNNKIRKYLNDAGVNVKEV